MSLYDGTDDARRPAAHLNILAERGHHQAKTPALMNEHPRESEVRKFFASQQPTSGRFTTPQHHATAPALRAFQISPYLTLAKKIAGVAHVIGYCTFSRFWFFDERVVKNLAPLFFFVHTSQ